MSATRYPLSWPAGWKRATWRHSSPFKTGRAGSGKTAIDVATAVDRLEVELSRLGAKDAVLSTNLPQRMSGGMSLDQRSISDPGAAVYFKLAKADRVLACDTFNTVAGNIAALAAHIEALRAIDRYGVGTIEQAFAGYTALGAAAEVEWWIVLSVPRSAPLASIEAAYRELAKKAHPDAGGSEAEMQRLNVARDAARKEKQV